MYMTVTPTGIQIERLCTFSKVSPTTDRDFTTKSEPTNKQTARPNFKVPICSHEACKHNRTEISTVAENEDVWGGHDFIHVWQLAQLLSRC